MNRRKDLVGDYVLCLIEKCELGEWKKRIWNGRKWGEAVKGVNEEESGHTWAREVTNKAALGQYEKLQTKLD